MALSAKMKNLRASGAVTHCLWDNLIFHKIKSVLGGNIKVMVSGSAPIVAERLEFLKIVFSCEIMEVYGLTETIGGFMQRSGDPVSGNVGGPIASTKVKLRDVPEMDMFTTDNPPRGEICFTGPSVTQGYFKDPKRTSEAFHNEWFRSGDIGQVNPNGSFKIIERCKHIFKTAAGEYISPQKLEEVFILSQWFDQVWIHGESI